MLSPAEWEAVAAVATSLIALAALAVAVLAAIYARNQVAEARRAREEQARPYVAAYLDLVDDHTIELVVKNFGATTARDISLTTDRPMIRYWAGEAEDLPTFDRLPVLVPGQAWSTVFDVNGERIDIDDAPYTVVVRSSDSKGEPLSDETFVLDARTYANKLFISRRSLHDVGESLAKIERTLSSWSENKTGLAVYARDGHAKDRLAHERFEARMSARQARLASAAVKAVEEERSPVLDVGLAATREGAHDTAESSEAELQVERAEEDEDRSSPTDTPDDLGPR